MPRYWVVDSIFLLSFCTTGGSEKAVETMASLTDQLSTHIEMNLNYIQNRKQSKEIRMSTNCIGSKEKLKETYTQRSKHINYTKQSQLGNQ